MIDEQHLRRLQLREHPLGQAIVGFVGHAEPQPVAPTLHRLQGLIE